VPKSYTKATIIDRYLGLQATSPGTTPSSRALARELSLAPSALYRYFTSMKHLEIDSTRRLGERLAESAQRLDDDPASRLAGLASTQPGLLWAACRLDSDRPPIDAHTLETITGCEHSTPAVRTALASTVGVLWRLHPDQLIWRNEIQRVIPGALRWFDAAAHTASTSARPKTQSDTTHPTLADVIALGDLRPASAAMLRSIDRDGAVPSLRHVADAVGGARTSLFRSTTAPSLSSSIRSAMFEHLPRPTRDQAVPLTPHDAVLANWTTAIDICFDRPAIVDVMVSASVDDNPHRLRQRKVWANTPRNDLFLRLSDDDLTDVLAGFIMFTARRHAATRDDAHWFVSCLIDAVVHAS
jgi:AcrR family transcriptional regulator